MIKFLSSTYSSTQGVSQQAKNVLNAKEEERRFKEIRRYEGFRTRRGRMISRTRARNVITILMHSNSSNGKFRTHTIWTVV